MIVIEIVDVYTLYAPNCKNTTCNLNPCITKGTNNYILIYASYYWLIIKKSAKFLTYWCKFYYIEQRIKGMKKKKKKKVMKKNNKYSQ